VNDAKCLQDSGFCALALNHLGAGNLLTAGVPEFTCLEFGSPSETKGILRSRDTRKVFDSNWATQIRIARRCRAALHNRDQAPCGGCASITTLTPACSTKPWQTQMVSGSAQNRRGREPAVAPPSSPDRVPDPRGGIRLGVLILTSGEPPKRLATELPTSQ
jgi:hypothetical protein